jgi:hypothetical protein
MSRFSGPVPGLLVALSLVGTLGLVAAPAGAATVAPAGTELVDEMPVGSGFQSFDSRGGYAVWQSLDRRERFKYAVVVRTPDGRLLRRSLRVQRHEIATSTSIERIRAGGATRLIARTNACSKTLHRCRSIRRDLLTGARATVEEPKTAPRALAGFDDDTLATLTPPKYSAQSPDPAPVCTAAVRSITSGAVRALPPLQPCSGASTVDLSGSVFVARVDRFLSDGTRDGSQDVAIDTAAATPAWVQLHRSPVGDGSGVFHILASPAVTPAPSFVGVEAQMVFPPHGRSHEVAPRVVLHWDLSAVAFAAAAAMPVVDSGLPALAATTVPISPALAAQVAQVGVAGTQLLAVAQRDAKDARGRAIKLTQIVALPGPV